MEGVRPEARRGEALGEAAERSLTDGLGADEGHRPRAQVEGGELLVGDLAIDIAQRRVDFRGNAVHLTPTEFDLLRALVLADGAVLTRTQLLNEVWGYRDGSGARTVDSHVRAIRRKTSDDLIRTVHGVGYSLGQVEA